MTQGLAEQHFHSYEDAKKWVDSWFASKDVSFFRRGIQMLPKKKVVDNTYSDMFLTNFLKIYITFHEKSVRAYSRS